jgi:FkbM family methyltransferase
MLRSLAERLSRGRVLRRRLPPAYGGHTLHVSPDSALKFWRAGLAQADPALLAVAGELVTPGATVWDLGANVGLFAFASAYLAGASGRVVAIEADDWLAELLRRSALTLPPAHAPVEVLAAAVSSALGISDFLIARRGRAGSHLGSVGGSTQTGGVREVRKVMTVTLDWLLDHFPAPQVVKIDVEGAEAACLAGAERLLGDIRPRLLCEVSESNAAAVGAIFTRHGYAMFDGAMAATSKRQPLAAPAWSTLAIPRERPG